MTQENKIVFRQYKNVSLRPIDKADIPNLLRWINDEDVSTFLGRHLPISRKDEEDWINGCRANGKDIVLAIEFSKNECTSIHVGNIGLHNINQHSQIAELGIMIGEKSHWGKGIGEKAINLILKYAFYTVNVRKVYLNVYSKNKRARKLYEKCGFIAEGVFKEHLFRNGNYTDNVFMAVFRETWKNNIQTM